MSTQATHAAPRVTYAVPVHVRWCRTDAAVIFLDLKRNRYFGLGAQPATVLQSLLEARETSTLSPDQLALANLLIERELLTENAEATGPAPAVMPRPTRSVDAPHARVPCHAGHCIRFAQALRWAKRRMDHQPLYATVCELRDQLACLSSEGGDPQRAIDLALVFRRLRPYLLTARERCLLHALTLVRFLILHQARAHWVIGVQTHPWKAHSWVQLDADVLDATPEQVVDYTPILVV
jgi:Transglutaminase-like superfamily